MLNWHQNNVNSYINHRSKMKAFVTSTVDIKLMLTVGNKLMSHIDNIFFNQNLFSTRRFVTNFFGSNHFPDTFLTSYWPHALLAIWYLQFDISRMSKSGLLCHDIDNFWHQFKVRVPTWIIISIQNGWNNAHKCYIWHRAKV